jgi:hypothetical protein
LKDLKSRRIGGAFDGYRGTEDLFQCADYNTAFIDQEVGCSYIEILKHSSD